MECKTAEELKKLAEAEGFEITEAEAYLSDLADYELDEEALKRTAGGTCELRNCVFFGY